MKGGKFLILYMFKHFTSVACEFSLCTMYFTPQKSTSMEVMLVIFHCVVKIHRKKSTTGLVELAAVMATDKVSKKRQKLFQISYKKIALTNAMVQTN
jgi:hypothetical protein